MTKVLIFTYHRIFPGNHIDPNIFEHQIELIKKHFVPVSLDDAVSIIRGTLSTDKTAAVITFDDGWADNFVYAYPILKKHNIKATIFISTSFISNREETRLNLDDYWEGRAKMRDLLQCKDSTLTIIEFSKNQYSDQFLTWQEIYAMNPVVQVESHGHTHSYQFISKKIASYRQNPTPRQQWILLSGSQVDSESIIYESGSALAFKRYYEKTDSFETDTEYNNRVKNELSTSKREIFTHTGHATKYLAWPYGEYNAKSLHIAGNAEFGTCLTTQQGYNGSQTDLHRIKRFSPPRSHFWFSIAIKGEIGMTTYLTILKIIQRIKNLSLKFKFTKFNMK